MRPREREAAAATPEPSPAPRIGANISSMVVRPPESGGTSDHEAGDAQNHRRRRDSSLDTRRRESLTPSQNRGSSPNFRRRGSPQAFRRRGGGSPPGVNRRGSPPAFTRRYSPPAFRRRRSPPEFHPRPQRFKDEPGYGLRGGSNSPPRGQRLDDSRYGTDFDHSVGSRFGRGFRGRGRAGRYRDISPHQGLGRGDRSFGRGYIAPARSLSPVEGEYVHRNDPNLSPREGDWICRNPSCGNLNFSRRTFCNNCNQFRYGSERGRFSRSPRRGFFNSPPPYETPARISGPPVDRGRRDISEYRSPHNLGVDDPRDFVSGPTLSRHGDRVPYNPQRGRPAYYEDEHRVRGKSDWPVHEEWDRDDGQRDGSVRGKRGYEQRPRSPAPRDRWVRDSRERSRSPFADRSPFGDRVNNNCSYRGRGRAGGRYNDSFAGRGRGADFQAGRGRAVRRDDSSFIGEGRGRRPGISRGGKGGIY